MSILEVDGVNLCFGKKTVLSDIYLKCKVGEIVGLVGRNGSGKSSLLQVVFGSLKGSSQSVRINEQYYECLFAKSGMVSYLPQERFLPGNLRVVDLMRMFSLESNKELYISIIEEVGIRKMDRIADLSTGLKRFVEVMIILYSPSRFILLDEPFTFLSPLLIGKVLDHLNGQLSKKGIILTDHFINELVSCADKLYILSSGSLSEVDENELKDLGYILKAR